MGKTRVLVILAIATLLLPLVVVPASAAPKEGNTVHTVRYGETLSGIALRYGVNMWTLARVNGIINPNRIYVGQRLVIPRRRPPGRVHIVRPGETLTTIAWRYGVSVWAIARANGITNLNYIYVGQRLTIPGARPRPRRPHRCPLPGSFPGPWTGEYFDNAALGGSAYASRTDAGINFDWDYGPPAGGMPTNHFSVRWTGTFHFDGGTYRFCTKVDDGVRVYVDGKLIINGWRDGGLRPYSAERALAAGDHTVKVEYYDSIEVARVYFWWKRTEGPAPTPSPTPPPSEGWFGQFYNNKELSGDPVATHQQPWIGFEWGTDSPMPGVRSDYFSARWTTRIHLERDHYRFCTMSDDGSRLWVDGQLVVDEWHPNNGVAYCGKYWAETGTHDVKVEYFEDGGDALIYVWWEPY